MEKETFKEAAEREYPEKRKLISKDILSIIKQEAFINGATWQQKQYTIEEQHAEHSIDDLDKSYIKGFNEGAEWQKQEMYTIMQEYAEFCIECDRREMPLLLVNDWIEHFKK